MYTVQFAIGAAQDKGNGLRIPAEPTIRAAETVQKAPGNRYLMMQQRTL
jgi:hypothetical protein